VVLAPEAEDRPCQVCGGSTYIAKTKVRWLWALTGFQRVLSPKVKCCDPGCLGHCKRQPSGAELALAPPYWSVSWDLFAWMGHRRFARHWSVPLIVRELADTYGLVVSADLVEDYTAKYEVLVAARESDLERLVAAYRDVPYLDLSIDGLQPEKGHETLYTVRELSLQRVWFAEPLLSSAAPEVHRLFQRAHEIATRLGKPVRCWISDKQEAFVSGVREIFPDVPHRYCQNHFLRDVAKPTLAQDSHAKVQMRQKVRGLRAVERKMLAEQQERAVPSTSVTAPPEPTTPAAPPPSDTPEQVVLDYCAAVRGILNDDQGGPLHPPGVRMAEALGEVRDSIETATAGKKGARAPAPSTPSAPASTAASASYASNSTRC
jgi:hypothetical protein